MTRHDFDTRRIGGRIGAEILGVDIARPLDPGVVAEINAALIEHKALFFREQRLDDLAQRRFASLFGELTGAPPEARATEPAAPPPTHEDGGPANRWHTEATPLPAPPRVTTLLQGQVTRPENVVRWRWAPGDLAIFDNRSIQHHAPDDHGTLPRPLRRVTVAGDVPVGTDGERSRVVEGDRAEYHTPASAA